MQQLSFLLSLILLFGLFSLSGCEEQESPTATVDAARDDNTASSEFEQVFQYVDDAANQRYNGIGKTTESILPTCIDTVWTNLDLANQEGSVVLDFGEDGCLCEDFVKRFGKVTTSWSGGYRQEGTKSTTELTDYFFKKPSQDDKIAVEGTRVVENLGNAGGNFKYNSTVDNAVLTYPDGETITWSSDLTTERIAGEETFNPFDDIYTVVGTSNGTTRKGDAFDGEITTPLRFEMPCLRDKGIRTFVDGNVTYTTANNTLELNYGYSDGTVTGDCDRKVQVTFNSLPPQVLDFY